jgi:hypoxanthine-guanine phosphoribosyltransferase
MPPAFVSVCLLTGAFAFAKDLCKAVAEVFTAVTMKYDVFWDVASIIRIKKVAS